MQVQWGVAPGAPVGVVCGRGRNPTLRARPSIFAREIDVLPSEWRDMSQEIGERLPAISSPGSDDVAELHGVPEDDDGGEEIHAGDNPFAPPPGRALAGLFATIPRPRPCFSPARPCRPRFRRQIRSAVGRRLSPPTCPAKAPPRQRRTCSTGARRIRAPRRGRARAARPGPRAGGTGLFRVPDALRSRRPVPTRAPRRSRRRPAVANPHWSHGAARLPEHVS